MKRVAVLCSGRGSNLGALIAARPAGAHICTVIANIPATGALAIAQQAGIRAHVLAHENYASRAAFDEALVALLHSERIDIVVLAGFMRLLTPTMIGAFRHRIINVHPSLLPAFPGAHAVRDALAYGAKITGVSVHFVDEGTDTGPLIVQESVPIYSGDDEPSLHARIQTVEHVLLPRAVGLACRDALRVEGRKVHVS